MATYDKMATINVALGDVLNVLEEEEVKASEIVLNSSSTATDAELRHNIGKVAGLKWAIKKLMYHYGATQVPDMIMDTRY